MSSVEIVDVQVQSPRGEPVRGFAIDAPRVGDAVAADGFELRGWVLGSTAPVTAVEVVDEGSAITRLPVGQRRDDVARAYPDVPGAGSSGFQGWVPAVGLDATFVVQAQAVTADGRHRPLATISGRRRPAGERPALALRRPAERGAPGMPDFVIIGTQRGGTTSLYRYLSAHPRVVPATAKEVQFFSLRFDRGLDWYRAHFPADRPAGTVSGEASPYYLFHPLAAQRLRACAPNARLLVLLRNPVDRAYSHYHLERGRGDETLSFEQAIAREEERLAGEEERLLADDTYASFAHQHHSYLARGRYADQLRRWLALFPRRQVLILKSEDLYDDPPAVVRQATDFLGLPPADLVDQRAYNEAPYPPLRAATRKRLSADFAEKNAELSALLGQDFGWPPPPPRPDRPAGAERSEADERR